jgi:CubicO group peptidase (beta-lactamase class C family)
MRKPHRLVLAFSAFFIVASGCLTACLAEGPDRQGLRLADPAKAGMDAATLAQIPERMRQFVAEKQISGAVTLVAKDGRIVHLEAVGLADAEAQKPMQKDTVFAIASMTKPITATALMIVADEGKLSVDDPVSKYIPQFEKVALATGPPGREITIRDLLTHTSGVGGGQRNQGSLKETVELLAKEPLRFEPGSKWQYSPGLTVCGRIIEVVSGQPYDEFLTARIFQPLGMVDTTFFPSGQLQARLARLYKPGADGKSIEPAEHWLSELGPKRTPNPSGGLFSTATDLARFYQMILDGGQWEGRRIVSEKAVREMTRLQTGDLRTGFTDGNGWGLGWCIAQKPQGVTKMLSPGTYGHGGAFGTQGWVDPVRRMIFVLMIQRTGFGNSDASAIRATLQQLAVDAVRE